jgi:hypothetical protein
MLYRYKHLILGKDDVFARVQGLSVLQSMSCGVLAHMRTRKRLQGLFRTPVWHIFSHTVRIRPMINVEICGDTDAIRSDDPEVPV